MTSTKSRNSRPPGYHYADAAKCSADVLGKLQAIEERAAWPLFIHGPTGVGKSCAAALLFGAYLDRPQWYRADDLLLSMSFGRANGVRIERYEDGLLAFETVDWSRFARKMQQANAVFLDDLGIRKPTESMHQSLFDLMEWRSPEPEKPRPLIITSNKTPEEIGVLYDDRILSRFDAGTVLELTGSDQREGSGYRVKAVSS